MPRQRNRKSKNPNTSTELWQGRFEAQPDPEALSFTSSLHIDRRLYREDIEGSIAHVKMLAAQKIIPAHEARKIQQALLSIRREIESGKFVLDGVGSGGRFTADDVHMAIEQRLIKKIGDIGGKLHTARSRNDQIALDERLYLRRSIDRIIKSIRLLQKAIVAKAEKYERVMIPGYTHLQHAQPILLAHHLLAYVSMLDRDNERFADCRKRVNRSPLGAAALAGTSFPINRNRVAASLGFDDIIENSIDAVSDRDVQIECIAACAITMMHLSRFAEELVLWTSAEWSFVEIGEAFTTGSSIMPQKKNPDVAELVRGKTGRVYGNLVALLTTMKALPLAYNRDLQEDKEPLFDAVDTVQSSLQVFAGMMKTLKFNQKRYDGDSLPDYLLATELADYLVRKGMPFRKAHAVVGDIVRTSVKRGMMLRELPLKEYQQRSKLFGKDLWKLLNVRQSLLLKKSTGSTSPREVRNSILRWKRKLGRP